LKVVLLAAGEGKRLRPATLSRPKPLLPIAGATLLDFHISSLKKSYQDLSLVVSYKKELFNPYKELGIKVIDQGIPLGTGHAVKILEGRVKGDFLLVYSDVYFPPKFDEELLTMADGYDHVVAVTPVSEPWEYGVVHVEDGLLKRIIEKPRRGEEPSNLIVAGAFLLSETIFDHLKEIGPSPRGEMELTDAITLAAEKGEKVLIVEISPWVDAGRLKDFLYAQKLLLYDIISGKRQIPSDLRLEEDILLGCDISLESVEIKGPVVIGPSVKVTDSYVGPNTYLEGSCRISDSEITGSIIMAGSLMADSKLTNSIVADNSKIDRTSANEIIVAPNTEVIGCKLESGAKIWENVRCLI